MSKKRKLVTSHLRSFDEDDLRASAAALHFGLPLDPEGGIPGPHHVLGVKRGYLKVLCSFGLMMTGRWYGLRHYRLNPREGCFDELLTLLQARADKRSAPYRDKMLERLRTLEIAHAEVLLSGRTSNAASSSIAWT